jgi:hypothetical protein
MLVFYIEPQVRYIMQCPAEMIEKAQVYREVRQVLRDGYNLNRLFA